MDQYKVPSLDRVFYIPNFVTQDQADEILQHLDGAAKPKWVQLLNRRLQNWGGHPTEKGMVSQPLPAWLAKYTDKVSALGIYQMEDDCDGAGGKEQGSSSSQSSVTADLASASTASSRSAQGKPTKQRKANHVLINEYLPGQGIMPHEDGPIYYPTIATISLGSHTVLNFYEKRVRETSEAGEASDSQTASTDSDPMAADSTTANPQDTGCSSGQIKPFARLLLEPNSLVVVQKAMYNCLHGIEEVDHDVIETNDTFANIHIAQTTKADGMHDMHAQSHVGCQGETKEQPERVHSGTKRPCYKQGDVLQRTRRVSLTIRHVTKTMPMKLLFGMSAKRQ
eukprot:m.4244 g.4244  ORF g.4244 m.4244 type:complete len:338 (-) comp4441_c0_seq1:187-1200(-)